MQDFEYPASAHTVFCRWRFGLQRCGCETVRRTENTASGSCEDAPALNEKTVLLLLLFEVQLLEILGHETVSVT